MWILGLKGLTSALSIHGVKKQPPNSGAYLGKILTEFLSKRRRRKLLGKSGDMLSWENFWIVTPLSPLSWDSESFRQGIGLFHSPRMKPFSSLKISLL